MQARGDQPEKIARSIAATRETVRPCPRCGFFTMEELCEICSDPSRAADLLCVVEQPTDILPLEKTSAFRGRYHSLGGRISPLDHVGPEDLRIKELSRGLKRRNSPKLFSPLPPTWKAKRPPIIWSISEAISRLAYPHRAWLAGRRRPRIRGRADALSGALRPDEALSGVLKF